MTGPVSNMNPEPRTPLLGRPWIAALVCVALWQGIGWWMVAQGLRFGSSDDFPRLVLSMGWADKPYFAPGDSYWLPLSFYVYGIGFKALGGLVGLSWHVPVSAFLMALASWLLMLATREASPDQKCQAQLGYMPWILLPLALTIRVNWRLAASGLSEPVYLACQSLLLWGLARRWRRGSRAGTVTILLGAVGCQMTRYEAWPMLLCWWLVAWIGPFAPPASARPVRRTEWIAGLCVLALFPLAWMAENELHQGHALNFFLHASEMARRDQSGLLDIGPFMRILQFAGLALDQGGPILLAVAWGGWVVRRNLFGRAFVLYVAFALTFYLLPALSAANSVGAARPERFCLGLLWSALPLAVWAFRDWLVRLRRPWWIPVLVFLLLVYTTDRSLRTNWGGPVLEAKTNWQLEKIARLTHTGNYKAVMDDALAGDGLNVLRVYAGLDRTLLRGWLPADRPVDGKYIYFTRNPMPGPPIFTGMLGAPGYVVDRLPAKNQP